MAEQRREPRQKVDGVVANVGNSATTGIVIDVSSSSAFLQGCYTDDIETTVVLNPPHFTPIHRSCKVRRRDSQAHGWIAVSWQDPLSPFEWWQLAPIAHGDRTAYDFA